MADLSDVTDPDLPVFYVDVYDSPDPPEVFSDEQTARRWVDENRPGWKVESEMVRPRWAAKASYEGAVEEAQAGGWYRLGPVPEPLAPSVADSEITWVHIAHSGLTTFVFADRSDADAIHFVWSLSPEHGSRHRLHTVQMRR